MEWVKELPKSRIYGGVHFVDAGEAGLALGKDVGHACSALLKRLLDGDMTATYSYDGRDSINSFNKEQDRAVSTSTSVGAISDSM